MSSSLKKNIFTHKKSTVNYYCPTMTSEVFTNTSSFLEIEISSISYICSLLQINIPVALGKKMSSTLIS